MGARRATAPYVFDSLTTIVALLLAIRHPEPHAVWRLLGFGIDFAVRHASSLAFFVALARCLGDAFALTFMVELCRANGFHSHRFTLSRAILGGHEFTLSVPKQEYASAGFQLFTIRSGR
jgi:hypothetical protein